MHLFVILAIFGLVIQPTCGHQYFVKLKPAIEGEVYQMKIGEIVTFELSTFEKTEEGDMPSQVTIDKTFWNFDKRHLEKIYSDNYSLQLKAIQQGATFLEITIFIGNSQDVKDLTILISE